MNFFVAGLSYKTAPVEVRERLSVHASRLRCQGCRLKIAGNLSELVLVSTCNRVEIYGVGAWPRYNASRLLSLLGAQEMDLSEYMYVHEGQRAIDHLFSVAGGLDSMVIGETEITGQIKQAYTAAQEARLTGKITNRLFQSALQVAKAIRTETAVGRGATSVGSVAVELAERIFDHDLSNKSVMIIGAGKMGEACLRHLSKKGAQSILVANRSFDRAVNLASEFGGKALRFDERLTAMRQADIVVSSTGALETILSRADIAKVMQSRGARPLFLIDIAVPRDIEIDVEQVPNVFLYNVDHLEQIVRENVRLREQELAKCREIIRKQTESCLARLVAAKAATSIPAKDESSYAWGAAEPSRARA